jgi:hypothetical protein
MVTRISKTGAIYYDYPPFDQAELEEGLPSEVKEGAAAKVIALERVEVGRHAFISVGEHGQLVGWCIKRDDGWYIQGRDGNSPAGPFGTLAAATGAAQQVLGPRAPVPVSKPSPH